MLNANQLMAANSNLFGTILNLMSNLGKFDSLTNALQYVLLVSFAIFVIGIVICIIRISQTYETRLLRCTANFNRYFKKNPYINEDNLVEVNNKFKAVPPTLRYSWQEYMLNRDRQPSEYINSVTCIDQPTRSSSYKNISNTVLLISIMVSVLTVFANLVCLFGQYVNVGTIDLGIGAEANAGMISTVDLFVTLLGPCVYMFVGLFITAFLKILEASRYADLYYQFHEFERYLNKACSTMPSFVDYEVLFTPKEIREAIPVLQEYLEKRALQEQKEAEEAEMNANHFENFNFEPVGVESALLLDRAMSEGERYFNFKRGLTERINAKEQEMFNYQKKFDEVTKEYERKSQAVRENMASINEQLNATSVKIEANYLKKRYNEEQQKQQQLEKDYEYAQINFTKQQQEMEQDIAQLTAEIKEKKTAVEENMMSECRNYSNKVWGEINKTLQAQQAPILQEKEERAKNLQEEIDKMTLIVADQDADIRAKQDYISQLEQNIRERMAEIEALGTVRDYFNSSDFRQRLSDKKKNRKNEEDDDEELTKTEPNVLADIVSNENRDEEIRQEGAELLEKMKEANVENGEYSQEVKEIKERQEKAEMLENNPFAAFESIQNDIEQTNNEYISNQQDLADTIENVESIDGKNAADEVTNEETVDNEPVESNESVEEVKDNAEDQSVNQDSESVDQVEEDEQKEQVEETTDSDNDEENDSPKRKGSLQKLLNSTSKLKK